MSSLNVALLGYGTVGKGVYQSIESHQERLVQLLGKPVKVVGLLVKNLEKHAAPNEEVLLTTNFEEILRLPDLHLVIDAIVGREPGFTYLKQAIAKGCDIITANKEMFAYHGAELQTLAKTKGTSVGFEATVAGGIPIIQTIRHLLQVNSIIKVEAILNGTSNFILSKMTKEGSSFEETLQQAQNNGYAEADPTNDVQGYDAFYKGMVLSELIYGGQPDVENVPLEGITTILPSQIEIASSIGLRFKHVVSLYKEKSKIICKVEPVLVTNKHPFYQVEDVLNSVSIETDLVGNIELQGPGAGKLPTASAVLEDIAQLGKTPLAPPSNKETDNSEVDSILTRWIVFGNEIALASMQAAFKSYKRIDEKAVLVEGKDIAAQLESVSGIDYYPLKGGYEIKAEKVLS